MEMIVSKWVWGRLSDKNNKLFNNSEHLMRISIKSFENYSWKHGPQCAVIGAAPFLLLLKFFVQLGIPSENWFRSLVFLSPNHFKHLNLDLNRTERGAQLRIGNDAWRNWKKNCLFFFTAFLFFIELKFNSHTEERSNFVNRKEFVRKLGQSTRVYMLMVLTVRGTTYMVQISH